MFEIDTGEAHHNHTALSDGIRDGLPDGHTEAEFCQAYAAQIREAMASYKQARWLRRFWLSQSAGLRIVSEEYPELFDELATEFATYLETLAQSDRADPGKPVQLVNAKGTIYDF